MLLTIYPRMSVLILSRPLVLFFRRKIITFGSVSRAVIGMKALSFVDINTHLWFFLSLWFVQSFCFYSSKHTDIFIKIFLTHASDACSYVWIIFFRISCISWFCKLRFYHTSKTFLVSSNFRIHDSFLFCESIEHPSFLFDIGEVI